MVSRHREFVISPDVDAALASWAAAAMVELPAVFPLSASAISAPQLVAFTDFHGITALLWAKAATLEQVPRRLLADAFARSFPLHLARELALRGELGLVLSAANERGLVPLVLKGTSLAYSLYPEPSVRQRHDTDLLVAPDDKGAMVELLQTLGYTGDLIAGEHWATSERTFTKELGPSVTCRLDMHWRLSNSPMFWHPDVEYPSLRAGAQALPRLHDQARCPRRSTLLLHACIHRAGHFNAPMTVNGDAYVAANRLIWLYDLHLLAASCGDADWHEFLDSATRMRVREISRLALEASGSRFHTPMPSWVVEALATRQGEASTAHITSREWRVKYLEFQALPSLAAQLGWLREHLMPRRDYMRARFGRGSRVPLIALHMKRLSPFRDLPPPD